MSRRLKPFATLPLKLLGIGTLSDRNPLLQIPAGSPQATFFGAAVPLEHPRKHPRGPLAEAGGWRHGGINE